MTEHLPEPPNQELINQFNEIVAESEPPTVEEQKEILDELTSRFSVEWENSGLTRDVIIRNLPDSHVGRQLRCNLAARITPNTTGHDVMILVRDENSNDQGSRLTDLHIPVAHVVESPGGKLKTKSIMKGYNPADSRTKEYPALVARQYIELLWLRHEGWLPNLNAELQISETNTSMKALPPGPSDNS